MVAWTAHATWPETKMEPWKMDLGDDAQCFGCLMMFVCLSLMWIFKGYKGAQAPKVCLACANLGAESSGFVPQRGGEIQTSDPKKIWSWLFATATRRPWIKLWGKTCWVFLQGSKDWQCWWVVHLSVPQICLTSTSGAASRCGESDHGHEQRFRRESETGKFTGWVNHGHVHGDLTTEQWISFAVFRWCYDFCTTMYYNTAVISALCRETLCLEPNIAIMS